MNAQTRRFGPYPGNDPDKRGIPTASAAYNDGYATGLEWKHDWRPGGPHVTSIGHVHRGNTDWEAFCNATAENRRMWLQGFDDARAHRPANWMADVEHCAVLGYN